jgi:hypothetical protein
MFLEEGVDSSLDFYLGQVCVGEMCHVKRKGKKTPLKSIVDDPFNERFDSNTRVERISLFSNLRAKFLRKNSIDFCRPSTTTLLIHVQSSSKAFRKLLVSLRPKAN